MERTKALGLAGIGIATFNMIIQGVLAGEFADDTWGHLELSWPFAIAAWVSNASIVGYFTCINWQKFEQTIKLDQRFWPIQILLPTLTFINTFYPHLDSRLNRYPDQGYASLGLALLSLLANYKTLITSEKQYTLAQVLMNTLRLVIPYALILLLVLTDDVTQTQWLIAIKNSLMVTSLLLYPCSFPAVNMAFTFIGLAILAFESDHDRFSAPFYEWSGLVTLFIASNLLTNIPSVISIQENTIDQVVKPLYYHIRLWALEYSGERRHRTAKFLDEKSSFKPNLGFYFVRSLIILASLFSIFGVLNFWAAWNASAARLGYSDLIYTGGPLAIFSMICLNLTSNYTTLCDTHDYFIGNNSDPAANKVRKKLLIIAGMLFTSSFCSALPNLQGNHFFLEEIGVDSGFFSWFTNIASVTSIMLTNTGGGYALAGLALKPELTDEEKERANKKGKSLAESNEATPWEWARFLTRALGKETDTQKNKQEQVESLLSKS